MGTGSGTVTQAGKVKTFMSKPLEYGGPLLRLERDTVSAGETCGDKADVM